VVSEGRRERWGESVFVVRRLATIDISAVYCSGAVSCCSGESKRLEPPKTTTESRGSGAHTAAEDVKERAEEQTVSIVQDGRGAGPTAAL
jgi:hypothetical protein